MKPFNLLLTIYLKCVLSGLFGLLVGRLIVYGSEYEFSCFQGVAMTFLILFFSLVVSILFVVPLSVMEKEKIQQYTIRQLMDRYLPFTTLPLFLLFCLLLLLRSEAIGTVAAQQLKGELEVYHFCLTSIIIAFCMTTGGMLVFIKQMKL